MSVRTVARFALVGCLVTSIAAPAAAQSPPSVRVVETRTGSFLFSGSYNTDAPIPFAPAGSLSTLPPVEVAPMPREKDIGPRIPQLGPLVLATDFAVPLTKGPFDKGQTVSVSPGVFSGGWEDPEVEPMPRQEAKPATGLGSEVGLVPPGPPGRVHCDFELLVEEVIPRMVVGWPATRPATRGCCDQGGFCPPLNSGPCPAPCPIPEMPFTYVGDPDNSPYLWRAGLAHSRPADRPDTMIALGKYRRDENGTWWVEVIRVPQPKFAPVRQHGIYCEPQAATLTKPECCSGTASNVSPTILGLRQAFGEDFSSASPPSCCTVPLGNQSALVTRASKIVSVITPSPYAGTWARELGDVVVAATLSPCGEELKLCLTQNADGLMGRLTVTADCKITKEGLVHGVVTGIDVDVKCDPKAIDESPFGKELAASAAGLADSAVALQELVDTPFSFRLKQTSAGLMVSNLKMGSVGPVSGKELAILCGMFKPCKDGVIPTPKPTKVRVSELQLPSGRYLEGHYPQYFAPDPQHPLPRESASQQADVLRAHGMQLAPPPRACGTPAGCGTPAVVACPSPQAVPCPAVDYGFPVPAAGVRQPGPASSWNPAQPANVPGAEFGMMADVFGQMLGAKSPPPSLPPAPATPPVAVQTLGLVVPQVPEGACPPCPLPTSTRPSITGTWVREVGPVVYVVKIAPDHLTISVTAATEVGGGKLMTQELVLTADYHLSRDGTTLVGLITGVDVTLGGDLADDLLQLPEMQGELARLQKAYADKPYAMGVRVYGDTLVIGNVRMPQVEGGDGSPLAILGGRYKNATDRPLPKPKAMKPATPATRAVAPGLPGSACLVPADHPTPRPAPAPVYDLPPGPVGESPYGRPPTWSPPSPRLQESPRGGVPPSAVVPAPGVVPRELEAVTLPPDNRFPPTAPRATERPVPPMATPTPPPEPQAAERRVKELLYQSETTGPIGRPVEVKGPLLYSGEDLRQIQNEWRRFWFNDQPGRLPPERVHGGIK